MLWLRAFIFTLLAPVIVGCLVPSLLDLGEHLRGGAWALGWVPVCAGTAIYLSSLLSFLAANGTPAPFFMRRLRTVLGEEPSKLVRGQLYRFTRNPMYVGVLTAIFGQAILFASRAVALYGVAAWVFMHLFVVFVEEPHLRAKQGQAYEDYCHRVPRWIGLPR